MNSIFTRFIFVLCMPCMFTLCCASTWCAQNNNHRLVILTDMGNEPDDSQTMVHLLLYANAIDIEGLISVTSRWLNPTRKPPKHRTYPELITERVHAYGKVRPNLLKHAAGWPTEQELHDRIAAGQPGYGMDSVGEGKASPGSRLIMRVLEKPDPRPVYFAINAGSNTLAQALFDLQKTRSQAEMDIIRKKIRVYDDAGQDNAGAWITKNFPTLFYARSQSQVFSMYCGYEEKETQVKGPYTWEPYPRNAQGQHAWAREHIQTGHGPLGALYPDRFNGNGGLEGGGTTTWIGLVNKGLYHPDQITWGGWGGRFTAKKYKNVSARYQSHLEEPYQPFFMYKQAKDQLTGEGITGFTEWVDEYRNPEYNPLWKWRRGYMNDFIARMDWCVKEFKEANHNPTAAFGKDQSDSIIQKRVAPGETVSLDASHSTDPDGDGLSYQWFIYPDAGTRPYKNEIKIPNQTHAKTQFAIPQDAHGCQIHLILQVQDKNDTVPLMDYRRLVLNVNE
ncbi:DUF1593 domain-containing protein [bacterium]|nr:DUF1593 domain-containing protein [bacterium]